MVTPTDPETPQRNEGLRRIFREHPASRPVTDPETPQTAAGRYLQTWLASIGSFGPSFDLAILAIEAEALSLADPLIDRAYEAGRAARDAEVRAAVEALRATRSAELHDVGLVWAAVLAILSDTSETGS